MWCAPTATVSARTKIHLGRSAGRYGASKTPEDGFESLLTRYMGRSSSGRTSGWHSENASSILARSTDTWACRPTGRHWFCTPEMRVRFSPRPLRRLLRKARSSVRTSKRVRHSPPAQRPSFSENAPACTRLGGSSTLPVGSVPRVPFDGQTSGFHPDEACSIHVARSVSCDRGPVVRRLVANENLARSIRAGRSLGVIAKWQGSGLQTRHQRFDSASRLVLVPVDPDVGLLSPSPRFDSARAHLLVRADPGVSLRR
jgi:hypothetical protein